MLTFPPRFVCSLGAYAETSPPRWLTLRGNKYRQIYRVFSATPVWIPQFIFSKSEFIRINSYSSGPYSSIPSPTKWSLRPQGRLKMNFDRA
ncbi:unnamed protein product [Malus baccata var. baccata]